MSKAEFLKCRNCGCFITKNKEGNWEHQSYTDDSILTMYCYICGCEKPEPEKEGD